MKRANSLLTISIFLVIQFLFINPINSTPVASADNSCKDFCGIAWRGTPADNIKYANQEYYKRYGWYYPANPGMNINKLHKVLYYENKPGIKDWYPKRLLPH